MNQISDLLQGKQEPVGLTIILTYDNDGNPMAISHKHSTPGDIIIIERSIVGVPEMDPETKRRLIDQEKQKYQ